MKASILDLRRKMRDVLAAIERNEMVTIVHRGKAKAVMNSIRDRRSGVKAADHPAFGMWADRRDLQNVGTAVRRIRRGRVHAL